MKLHPFILLAAIAMLSACKPSTTVDTDSGQVSHTLDGELTIDSKGHPKAKVTAAGDLIIDGKPVTLTAEQRKLVTAYYGELAGITQAGIAIGKQGTQLAGKAVSAALHGVLSGETDDIDAKVEAEAKKIEEEAKRICVHLGGLKTAQDALAAQVPAFVPYANVDQSDIDDCGKE